MSYFIPRPRVLNITDGSLEGLRWPADATITAVLTPGELFGNSDLLTPRYVLPGTPQVIKYNANNGKSIVVSDAFLPRFQFEALLPNGITARFDSNILTTEIQVSSLIDLKDKLAFVEHYLPTYLSLSLGVYIRADRISGVIASTIKFNYLLDELDSSGFVTNEEARISKVKLALDIAGRPTGSVDRFFLACSYFQQALRISSPHEVEIPAAHISEAMLNLAKSIEILFSDSIENIRLECNKLGYTTLQIESQIVPLMILRSKMDIAHPVSGDMSLEDVKVIHDYCSRSIFNVRNLLLRIASSLNISQNLIAPLSSSTAKSKEREKLISALREHLNQPVLPEETSAINDNVRVTWSLKFTSDTKKASNAVKGSSKEHRITRALSRFNPNVVYSNSAEHHKMRGISLYNSDEYKEAQTEFLAALSTEPTKWDIHFCLALSYIATEQLDLALEELDHVLTTNPQLWNAEFFKGLTIAQKVILNENTLLPKVKAERLQEALSLLEQNLDTHPPDGLHFYYLGRVSWLLKKRKQALEYMKKSVDLDVNATRYSAVFWLHAMSVQFLFLQFFRGQWKGMPNTWICLNYVFDLMPQKTFSQWKEIRRNVPIGIYSIQN